MHFTPLAGIERSGCRGLIRQLPRLAVSLSQKVQNGSIAFIRPPGSTGFFRPLFDIRAPLKPMLATTGCKVEQTVPILGRTGPHFPEQQLSKGGGDDDDKRVERR